MPSEQIPIEWGSRPISIALLDINAYFNLLFFGSFTLLNYPIQQWTNSIILIALDHLTHACMRFFFFCWCTKAKSIFHSFIINAIFFKLSICQSQTAHNNAKHRTNWYGAIEIINSSDSNEYDFYFFFQGGSQGDPALSALWKRLIQQKNPNKRIARILSRKKNETLTEYIPIHS